MHDCRIELILAKDGTLRMFFKQLRFPCFEHFGILAENETALVEIHKLNEQTPSSSALCGTGCIRELDTRKKRYTDKQTHKTNLDVARHMLRHKLLTVLTWFGVSVFSRILVPPPA